VFKLEGRCALVTGASRGIGRATAVALARAGATLALTARDEGRLREVAATLAQLESRAVALPADLADADAPEQLIARTLEHLGALHILVNNAGLGAGGSVFQHNEETFLEVLRVNLQAPYALCRHAAVPMRAQGWGRIINISSISGQTGGIGGAPGYAASKGGLIAMTKTLARDLGPFGITVNAIAPGQIETDMGRVPPERLGPLLAQIPVGRIGQPEDIAAAVLFLASDEAGYVSGATLDVNGGLLKR
jgi:3-oxoacyl-[acyl-carrier protein] reductase